MNEYLEKSGKKAKKAPLILSKLLGKVLWHHCVWTNGLFPSEEISHAMLAVKKVWPKIYHLWYSSYMTLQYCITTEAALMKWIPCVSRCLFTFHLLSISLHMFMHYFDKGFYFITKNSFFLSATCWTTKYLGKYFCTTWPTFYLSHTNFVHVVLTLWKLTMNRGICEVSEELCCDKESSY